MITIIQWGCVAKRNDRLSWELNPGPWPDMASALPTLATQPHSITNVNACGQWYLYDCSIIVEKQHLSSTFFQNVSALQNRY